MADSNTATQQRGQGANDSQPRPGSNAGGATRQGDNASGQQGGEQNRQGDKASGRQEHAEGSIARTIEQQTAKLPSDLFLWAAGASMGGSLFLHCTGRKEASVFVGQWVPSLLMLGVYNKIVKVLGSEPRPAA